MCRVFLGVTDAETVTMMALDRLGVDLRVVTTAGATSEFRVAFRETVTCRFDAQSALVKALQESWEKENGFADAWEEETPRVVVKYYGRA